MALIHDELLDAVRAADRAAAGALLAAWAEEHGWDHLLPEVLEPALRSIGEEWLANDRYTIAQVYVAGKIAGDALLLMAARRPSGGLRRGPVVLGNVEDDFHSLGRKLVGTFLQADGWDVHDLGNDVPAQELVDQALATGARVIGVSAMVLTTALNIRRVRAELDARGLRGRVQLAVGGAVFLQRPELVQEVGADGTAPNALGASALFQDLAARANAVNPT